MAPGREQENVHVTVDMRETCVTSVLNCTLKSKMQILKPNVQVSLLQVLLSLQVILVLMINSSCLKIWKGFVTTKIIGW